MKRALEMIQKSGIIEECYGVVRDYCLEASKAIESLPDCPAQPVSHAPISVRDGENPLALPHYLATHHGHNHLCLFDALRVDGLEFPVY